MGKNVIVSFEGEIVRVVYTSNKRMQLVIDDALTFTQEEFDDFLEKEKAKEFIVVNNFVDSFQDIFLIPPVKKKYQKNLIESEIKQKTPFEDFNYTYRVIGEKLEGKRKMQEVSVFVVKTDDVTNITERFIEHKKLVKGIFPHIYSVASEVDFGDESVLCVSETGNNRILFLIKNGKIEFVRAVQSSGEGINDADIQSINVTVNYCKQVLKTEPAQIVLIGNLCQNFNTTMAVDIPIVCPLVPKKVKAQSDVYLDFVYPISALGASKDIDVTTKDYKGFYMTWKMLKYSAAVFLVLAIAGGLFAGYSIVKTLGAKSRLKAVKREIHNFDENILIQYNKRKAEFESYKGFAEAAKLTATMPIIKNFLTSFSDAKTDNVTIESIIMRVNGGTLKTTISGTVNSETDDEKGGLQRYTLYQEFIDSISGLKGISVRKHSLTPKKTDFNIELESR
jgi:hypothetical protein